MQLTTFSDYSLRVLLYLGAHQEELSKVSDIAASYGISQHHLVKVAHQLAKVGWVDSVRGRKGGLRLAVAPGALTVADVLRETEPHFHIVSCFDRSSPGSCPIVPACQLKGVLAEAQAAFMEVLSRYTLADLLEQPERLRALLKVQEQLLDKEADAP